MKDHMENYEFVSKDATYITVRKKFEHVKGKISGSPLFLLRRQAARKNVCWVC